MVVVERHPGSPDERWRLEGAADIFYEYVYIWNQEQLYLLDVLGDMCAVRAVAASEIAAVHACLLAEGGEH